MSKIQITLHCPNDGHMISIVTCDDCNDFWKRVGRITGRFICIAWIDEEPASALLTYVPENSGT